MSTGPAAVFHRQPEPLPESADQVLLASIFERVLSREAGRAAAVDMIATFHGLAGVAAADEAALLRAGLHRGGVAELVRIRDMALAMTRAWVEAYGARVQAAPGWWHGLEAHIFP